MLTDFQNFSTDRLICKFATKSYLNITFTNVFFIFVTFLRFLTFKKILSERFLYLWFQTGVQIALQKEAHYKLYRGHANVGVWWRCDLSPDHSDHLLSLSS